MYDYNVVMCSRNKAPPIHICSMIERTITCAEAMKSVTDGSHTPSFVKKLYDMLDDPSSTTHIYWTASGDSFVVPDPNRFSRLVLPA